MTVRARRAGDPRIELLLEVLDQAFDRHGWHGTTLRGSLRGVTSEEALWRPAAGRHNIWELAVHTAYWKYAVRRRLAGDAAGSFPRKPSNWPAVPEAPDVAAWKGDIRLLEREHQLLREAVRTLSPGKLEALSPKGVWTSADDRGVLINSGRPFLHWKSQVDSHQSASKLTTDDRRLTTDDCRLTTEKQRRHPPRERVQK